MRTKRTAIATATLLALIASSCGSDSAIESTGTSSVGSTPVTTEVVVDASTTVPVPVPVPVTDAGGGWIDGEPEWSGGGGETAEGADAASSGDALYSEAPATVPASREASAEESAPAPDFDSPLEEPCVDCAPAAADNTPLRAGSVDDNAEFDDFLTYLDRLDSIGIERRDFDPTGRIVATVTDDAGATVAGARVDATVGDVTVALRTTADGTVRFHPAAYGFPVDSSVTFTVPSGDSVGASVTAEADSAVTVVSPEASAVGSPVALDVLFLLDATGSMGDEIDRLKTTIDTVADRIAALDPAPDVRFAMTLYRDEGDAFVTSTYDFTGDVAEFQSALAAVVADGGGDYPEALDEGLADALGAPAWRDPAEAVQLVFVVADAPPQVTRQVEVPYSDSIRTAIERGIKLFPIASSNADDQAEAVFRQMAQATGAPFVFLSQGAGGASVGENTDIASTDYEELALDELVVRLVAEELSDLDGSGDVSVPTTSAPPTTNPDGQ